MALDPLDERPRVPLGDHHHPVELLVGGVLDQRCEGLHDGHRPLPRHDADVRVLPLVVLGQQLSEPSLRRPTGHHLAVHQQVDDVPSPIPALVLQKLEVPDGQPPPYGRPDGRGEGQ